MIFFFFFFFFFGGGGGVRKINIFGRLVKLWIFLDFLGSHFIHFRAFFLRSRYRIGKCFLGLLN